MFYFMRVIYLVCFFFFFSSRRRHTRCALVTGVQTCALPIFRFYIYNPFVSLLPWNCCAVSASNLRRTVNENRSEEHTSELQSLMRISYAVFCLKKKTKKLQAKIHNKTERIIKIGVH